MLLTLLTISKMRTTIAVLINLPMLCNSMSSFHVGKNLGCKQETIWGRGLSFIKAGHINTFFALFLPFFYAAWKFVTYAMTLLVGRNIIKTCDHAGSLEHFLTHLSLFKLISTHVSLLKIILAHSSLSRLIWGYIGSFQTISAYIGSYKLV